MESVSKGTLQELTSKKIEELGEELRNLLSDSVCTGYSFYDTKAEKTSRGIELTCKAGLRLKNDAGEILVSADIRYDSRIPQGRTRRYVTLDIDYVMSKGRDLSFKVSDQIDFVDGDHWSESLYKIPATKIMFTEVLRMTHPLTLESPMPLF